jgi:hypothetical protein
MTGKDKQKTLILLGLTIIITVIIAASLPQLELRPGMPVPRLENSQVVLAPIEEEPLVAISINEFFKVVFILALAGSMLYVIYRLIKRVGWASVRYYLQFILVIGLIAGSVAFLIMLLPTAQSAPPMEIPLPTSAPLVTSPLGPVPVVLVWLVGIGLLVSSILLGYWMLAPSKRATAIGLVGLEAEKARQGLLSGLDFKDVIIKCYQQMSLVLEEDRGLEREDFMTTREFENLLEAAGIPHDPIHQLTQLFEAVRYGNWQPHALDEQNALNCLEAIIYYSTETEKTGRS